MWGATPLMVAAMRGQLEVMTRLLELGASLQHADRDQPDYVGEWPGFGALHAACF